MDLRRLYPKARFVLWVTDSNDGEIIAEVRRVAERLKAAGENRLDVVPVSGLDMTSCHYHPSLPDDAMVASALSDVIDSHPKVWGK